MKIEIISLKNLKIDTKLVQDFLFKQIKKEYGYGYIANFHQDIIKLKETYLDNNRNNFFIAINLKNNEIIASIAIREYDKNFKEFENLFSRFTTASIWRLFVDEEYRRLGIAKKLVKEVELFSKEKNYSQIYLHTHKTLDGALEFWTSQHYNISIDTENEFKTVHMVKNISTLNTALKYQSKISI
ncbi:MAG: GNAT family N-acetyltransferase [Methanobacteriaceae archaeon]|jgi:ribosomal protein S18 acetylase RimI-like enzyme|nr:GNAT family N-acetyltransferase [Methanobacteriaceae archaeon]